MKSFLCESGSKFLLPYIVCVRVRACDFATQWTTKANVVPSLL